MNVRKMDIEGYREGGTKKKMELSPTTSKT